MNESYKVELKKLDIKNICCVIPLIQVHKVIEIEIRKLVFFKGRKMIGMGHLGDFWKYDSIFIPYLFI
jgi:hypothetical protein